MYFSENPPHSVAPALQFSELSRRHYISSPKLISLKMRILKI